eukprot:scaffold9009_cov58-Phaeocystis_antarctica.AAC.2
MGVPKRHDTRPAMLSSGQLTRPVHVPPMRSFAAHRDTRPGAPRDGPPQHPRGRRELPEVSSWRDARHRRLARRVWPPRVRRMYMHRATHAITGVGITVMIKQLVMVMSLMIVIAQRQAALAMRVVLPPALPPAPPRRCVRSCVRRAELPRGGARAATCAAACVDICLSVMCLPGRSCSGGAGGLGTRMRRRAAAAAAAASAARVAGHMLPANMLWKASGFWSTSRLVARPAAWVGHSRSRDAPRARQWGDRSPQGRAAAALRPRARCHPRRWRGDSLATWHACRYFRGRLNNNTLSDNNNSKVRTFEPVQLNGLIVAFWAGERV